MISFLALFIITIYYCQDGVLGFWGFGVLEFESGIWNFGIWNFGILTSILELEGVDVSNYGVAGN